MVNGHGLRGVARPCGGSGADVSRRGQEATADNTENRTAAGRGGRGGRNGLEHKLRRLGVKQKNGRPNHPQTRGKIERYWQTLKKWLAAQPQPADLAQLQALLDAFAAYYNHQRPHRCLPHRATPATAYAARHARAISPHHAGNQVGHWSCSYGAAVRLALHLIVRLVVAASRRPRGQSHTIGFAHPGTTHLRLGDLRGRRRSGWPETCYSLRRARLRAASRPPDRWSTGTGYAV